MLTQTDEVINLHDAPISKWHPDFYQSDTCERYGISDNFTSDEYFPFFKHLLYLWRNMNRAAKLAFKEVYNMLCPRARKVESAKYVETVSSIQELNVLVIIQEISAKYRKVTLFRENVLAVVLII